MLLAVTPCALLLSLHAGQRTCNGLSCHGHHVSLSPLGLLLDPSSSSSMADDDSVYSEGDEEDSVYPDSIRFYMLLHHSLLSKPVLVSASLRPGTGTDTPLHLIHENTNKMYDPATACHRPAAHRPPPSWPCASCGSTCSRARSSNATTRCACAGRGSSSTAFVARWAPALIPQIYMPRGRAARGSRSSVCRGGVWARGCSMHPVAHYPEPRQPLPHI